MGLAKHKKLSKSEYDSLSTKDEDTIYAVNESGDFSEENLDDTAELFIGDKKITNDIPYGECNVSPSTVEKQVTTLNGNFKLKQGAKVSVKFLQGHTADIMTLNVDGTGAKNVNRDGHALLSNMIKATNVYDFVYDGACWRIVGVDTDTTYSNATQSANGLMSSADKIKLDSMATGAGYEANLKWGGRNLANNYSPLDAAMIPMLGADRFACLPVGKVDIEYSRDKGVTWVDYEATNEEKQALFEENLGGAIQVGGKEATPSINNMVRITINTAPTLYVLLRKFIIYSSNNSGDSNSCHVTISGRTQQNYEDNNDTWVVFADKAILSGWPGWNVINTNDFYTYGNQKDRQYGQIRFTFGLDSLLNQNIGLLIKKISAYGQAYVVPNNLAMYARPFQYNYDGSMVLPKGLEIKGGDIKLANFANAKIHGFPSSVANGNYSSAIGYEAFTGIRTGDTAYPYVYITNVSPLPFNIVDDTLYGVSLAKGDSTTYTYNGNDYTVTNPSGSYAASVFLVQDSDGLLVKGTSYPMNICVVAKSAVTIGNGRILSAKNITGDIWELIINQQNNTIDSYISSLNLYLLKKTSSTYYTGANSVASGYSSIALGNYSIASGQRSIASGTNSIVLGSDSVASGNYSVSIGYYSVARGGSSVAMGRNSNAFHQDSVILATYGISGRNQQCVVGIYNKPDSSALFVVGNGSSDTSRSNAMTVSSSGVTANAFKGALQGNADTATKVNNALTIKKGNTTDTFDGSTAKTIDITDLQNIGDLNNLQTSNKSNLVDAINEVNQKATNNQGGGVINDSTISPFAGFMPNNVGGIIEESYAGTVEGVVVCNYERTRFYYRIPTDAGYRFYANWRTSYLYNTTSNSYTSAKTGKIFSYNDTHYIVINGTLQDISNIEITLKSYTDSTATDVEYYATLQANNALGLAKSHSNNNLTIAKNYTDSQITAKIQLVPELPTEPTSGVLYLIAES